MVTMKRNLTFKESFEEDSKKLRSELGSIENLSNEIFYEIFDYLDGLDICMAFSNPKLKSNELYLYGNQCSISIQIKYLKIAHWYAFDEFNVLISYTSNLRRLNLSHASKDDSDVEDMLPMNLNNLIHLP
ncbi:unnamed protein product [Adineta steineri]|uniref:F-box domain-containing protein n=1 Tax=Adineta steineri TaxID=433720 RepID=A0A815EV12_9BILA|nr:unnamed protein product [Adineta steineri]CAF1582168.1 unnamed protein product [Adineta steineri]